MSDKEMRAVFAETLIELASKDENIALLEADLAKSSGTLSFKKQFPDRFFDVGVAEANMVGISAGLSVTGKIPIASTFACFASRRAYDQFFISCNYAKLNVKLVGSDPGVTAAFNGGTHMPFEDIALMRVIPDLIVFEPCDTVSLKKLLLQSISHKGCTYMRLHRKSTPVIYDEKQDFELGKGVVLKEGKDVTIVTCGALCVNEALKAAQSLEKEGITPTIIDMHTIKPIDKQLLVKFAKKSRLMVTFENHQIINGLGSAVTEVLSYEYPIKVVRVGVEDMFGEVGTVDYLKKRFGICAENLVEKIKQNYR